MQTKLTDEKIKEFASQTKSDEATFLQYFKLFQALYETESSTSYANYFHGIPLLDLENINKIKNQDSLINATATFINEVTFNKKRVLFELSDDASMEKVLKVLKLLKEPKKYLYVFKKGKPKKKAAIPKMTIDFKKYTELFSLIDKIEEPDFFKDFVKEVIAEKIDVARIFYINLDKVPIEQVLEYSEKYKNRIKELYAFSNKEYHTIQKICELNSESLIRVPNSRIDLYTNLKNVEIITINSEPLPNPLPKDFNYASVKNLETIMYEDDKKPLIMELINKCSNLEILSFSSFAELPKEAFFEILTTTTSKKIRVIEVGVSDIDVGEDFTPIFNNLPKLSKFKLELHASMEFLFNLLPCVSCERVSVPNPLLEQLLRNYIQEDESNFISARFDQDYAEFYDYFKDKTDIMNRFDSFYGNKFANSEIPYLNNVNIRNLDEVKTCIAKKIGDLIIHCPLDQEINEFIAQTKPTFVKIKEGDLKTNTDTKIVYNLATEEIKY